MIYILLSIILSSFLVISFKIFDVLKIKTPQAVAFNYFAAAACGAFLSFGEFSKFDFLHADWLPYIFILGASFISVFMIIGSSVPKVGIAPVSIAQKMSLIIPVGFTIYVYNEKLGWIKLLGILLALVAIIFTSRKEREKTGDTSLRTLFLPMIIFVGSGIVDIGIKLIQSHYSQQADMNLLLTCTFGSAGIIGAISLLVKREKIELRAIAGGLCLGVINYSATYCFIKALSLKHMESSVIFPVNNIGVILFSTFIALIFFKEKIKPINWLGIFMAIISILLISFS